MKLVKGQKMPEIYFQTAFKKDLNYLECIKGKSAILMFLRYYGCTVCQLDLIEIEERISEFRDNNIDIKVVLQSEPSKMKENLSKYPLSYDIICDPQMQLYNEFEIVPAKSIIKLSGGKTIGKVIHAKKLGLKHGDYEGNEFQLPAVFIINDSGIIVYSHYSKNLGDLPSVEDLLIMVRELAKCEHN